MIILYKYRYICICYTDNKFIHPHTVVVVKGDLVQFSCYSYTKVTWTLSLTKVIHFRDNVKQHGNIILVKNVQKFNEGDYYCKGSTQVQIGMKKELTNFFAKATLWIRGKMQTIIIFIIAVVVVIIIITIFYYI